MKKILLFTICILFSVFTFINETTVKFFISFAIPKISFVDKKMPSHLALLDRGNLSRDIFKKVNAVENSQYDINEKIEDSIPENTEYSEPNYYEVTLDWSTMLKNLTSFKVNVEELLAEELKFKLKKEDIETVIYHTHTTEAYTQSKEYMYEESGVYRTLTDKANMIKIGEQIKKDLQKYGVGVYHDTTIYDYPDYNSSYTKAGKGIIQTLDKYKKTKIVLDVHRDAISINTEQYKPIVKIDNKNVAQFFFVRIVKLIFKGSDVALNIDAFFTRL